MGTLGRGTGPRNLGWGGRLCVLERWPSEVEEVPDCSGLNGGVISNPPHPMTLRAGPQGTGEPSREWGGSEASQPSQSFRGGLSGNGMLPVFCSICRPPVGRSPNTKVGIPTLLPTTHIRPIFSSRTSGVTTRQIWRVTTPPQKRAQFDRKRPPSQLVKSDERWHRLKSSLLFNQKRALPQTPSYPSNPTKPETTHKTLKSSLLVVREQPM